MGLEDLLHQNSKGRWAHAAHFPGYVLHIRATGDKAVVSLLPVPLLVILDAVLQPLAFVLVLLQFDGGLGILLFQFLA